MNLSGGPALSQADLGTPLDVEGAAYSLCLFDDGNELVSRMRMDRAAGVSAALVGSTNAKLQVHGDDLEECFSATFDDVEISTTSLFKAKN